MNQERVFNVLLGPHVSEKSTVIADSANQVVFKVAKDATKDEVKAAVEQLFEVKVDGVRVVNVKGKKKGFGRIRGRRSDWKKAYVALAEGQEIDIVGA
ncbi:50S ribosomal protein L23 [Alkalilimnicola ehrlichii]|uniref:Large ribosomal subunit protein uL23 n=1 Tax=Alkalilimnicola ehrlichii TaxID=351052 RepID=A0A3E0X040_9GAMM|nr:50S ribosomal protein L23 [Alkalilimnicola ehrlichii]RFA30197.1 50S ribosomal protein L23 [Alkalilimnicola ehrlichii]RFA37781.1 50S ribosomal protein L23 [Alkalilimnicola ehrlichii]